MKIFGALLISLALSSSAFAEGKFYNVVANECDGQFAKPIAGQRFYMDVGNFSSVLGMGFTSSGSCEIMNYFLLNNVSSNLDSQKYAFALDVGGTDSCAANNKTGPSTFQFSEVTVAGPEITFSETAGCSKLVLTVEEAK